MFSLSMTLASTYPNVQNLQCFQKGEGNLILIILKMGSQVINYIFITLNKKSLLSRLKLLENTKAFLFVSPKIIKLF